MCIDCANLTWQNTFYYFDWQKHYFNLVGILLLFVMPALMPEPNRPESCEPGQFLNKA